MISKSIIVFWSVVCLTLTMHLVSKNNQGTLIYILGNGLVWAIVVAPTALIGQLFKSRRIYSPKMQTIRGGILTAIGLIAFVLANSSQHSPKQAQQTERGFQPWTGR